MLCLYEVEAPSEEFTAGSATNDGEPARLHRLFTRQWFVTEDGDDYQYILGSRIRRGLNDDPMEGGSPTSRCFDGCKVFLSAWDGKDL